MRSRRALGEKDVGTGGWRLEVVPGRGARSMALRVTARTHTTGVGILPCRALTSEVLRDMRTSTTSVVAVCRAARVHVR